MDVFTGHFGLETRVTIERRSINKINTAFVVEMTIQRAYYLLAAAAAAAAAIAGFVG